MNQYEWYFSVIRIKIIIDVQVKENYHRDVKIKD